MKTTLRLSLYVTYETHGEASLAGVLSDAAMHLSDNGLLTGSTDAEVIECTHEIAEVPAKLDQTAAPDPQLLSDILSSLHSVIEVVERDDAGATLRVDGYEVDQIKKLIARVEKAVQS